jgi:plasmid stabilization system protein ParE
MRLRWDRRAIKDIQAIYAYIAADNPKAATGVVDPIGKSISRLLIMPMSARPRYHEGHAAARRLTDSGNIELDALRARRIIE